MARRSGAVDATASTGSSNVVRISVATSRTDFTARDADFAALIRTADGKSLKSWVVPIPGTTKLHRLGENIAAAAVELTTEDISEIDSAVSRITVQGTRYPEKLEQMTGRRETRRKPALPPFWSRAARRSSGPEAARVANRRAIFNPA